MASGQTQMLLQNPAIYDKFVGPIFRPELVVARLQPSEDDSLVALRADADRGEQLRAVRSTEPSSGSLDHIWLERGIGSFVRRRAEERQQLQQGSSEIAAEVS